MYRSSGAPLSTIPHAFSSSLGSSRALLECFEQKRRAQGGTTAMAEGTRVRHGVPAGVAAETSEADARFAAVEPHPFTIMPYWNILKDEPKRMDVANKGLVVDSNAPMQHTPQDSNTVNQGGTADQSGASMGKRPLGRDGAKEAKKKGVNSAASAGSVEYASKFHDLSIEKLSFIKESDKDQWQNG
ncbi:hypothetical protein BAE44_0013207 [Dichanthelium oligosanthes]|uniref:Uncharacterized protein n=1 Tax=Dichanthelium oligosanthes TaxID=888268 RepID=A0A1E5VKY8_9POAL|nr:hypothetical protein BAE44_0013207 [Dichanthelium oligosanthes]